MAQWCKCAITSSMLIAAGGAQPCGAASSDIGTSPWISFRSTISEPVKHSDVTVAPINYGADKTTRVRIVEAHHWIEDIIDMPVELELLG